MSGLLLLMVATLLHTSCGLYLPINSSVLPAQRDPCRDRPPSSHGFPTLPFWTRVSNDEIYFNLTKGGDVLDPIYKEDLLESLDFIRTNTREEWVTDPARTQMAYHHAWVWIYWNADLAEGRTLTEISSMQAANVITTVCGLVSAYGPEEMESVEILDSTRKLLADFGMIFTIQWQASISALT